MKRNERTDARKKRLILTALLGLACAALTGCYIAPDDISTDQNTRAGNSDVSFLTLAPTETVVVTPDTVVVQTQNLFGGGGYPTIAVTRSATATPVPQPGVTAAPPADGQGWTGWGTVATDAAGASSALAPTSTPDAGVVLLTTRTPSPGMEGVGTGTQTSSGTTPTPRATIQVVTAAPATPTPTPRSLQRGFTDSNEVREMQRRLKALGWYSGSADGDFGPATEAAVKAFQKANGLTADGKAGQKTLEKMNSSSAVTRKQAEATPTPKPTARPTATPKPTKRVTATPRPTATPNLSKDYYLQAGASGKRVTTLQNRLIQLGWLAGQATGTYDEATEAAVTAFQKRTKGLWDDGVAGPDTLKALYSDSAARASAVAASTGETLERGSEGDAVRAMQKRLKELGYLRGNADGSFGEATENAVLAFQRNNGLKADGRAGTATLNKVYAKDAVRAGAIVVDPAVGGDSTAQTGAKTSGISSTGYTTLEEGSTGSDVRRLQSRLKELGYYNGSVDGSFGEGTTAAVMAFQLRNRLTVDGKAGPATQRALYGSGTAVTWSSLREGESGQAVRSLQYTLYELGYYDGKIDGVYGTTTSDAVRAFQIQNRLSPVDGVAGSATLAKLYSPDAVTASSVTPEYEAARPGDRGELVEDIQDCLVAEGYLDHITGLYDDATTEAVKAFQRDHGLTPDGVAGEKTLVLLFGY